MKQLTVGINDCVVSCDPEITLMTYALGSCIAVLIHDPVAHIAGLLHFMLPEAGDDTEKAQVKPYMFATTGIPMLFRRAYRLGAVKQRLTVCAVGGAHVLNADSTFDIGKRNRLALRNILSGAGVMLSDEEVGGRNPRSVRIQVRTGVVTVSQGREQHRLLPALDVESAWLRFRNETHNLP